MGMAKPKGFTLTEMLVVLATIMLLAAVSMPVFRAARESAKQVTCLSNFRQVSLATQIYLGDYEDRMTPVNHRPGQTGPPGEDRSWVQLVLPYVRSFGVFKCPSDYGRKRGGEGVFDGDLVVNDSDARFFVASQRVNTGYNHQYLAPIVRQGNQWVAIPRFSSQVPDPSKTLAFVDSAWSVDAQGRPNGGGRWIVTPPCRYELRNGSKVDTFAAEGAAWSPDTGWEIGGRRNLPFGGAWAWHSGRVNTARLDGSAKSVALARLSAGCKALPDWKGLITDPDDYIWDLR